MSRLIDHTDLDGLSCKATEQVVNLKLPPAWTISQAVHWPGSYNPGEAALYYHHQHRGDFYVGQGLDEAATLDLARRAALALNLVEHLLTVDLDRLTGAEVTPPTSSADVPLAHLMDWLGQRRAENEAALAHARRHRGEDDPGTIHLRALVEEQLAIWQYLRTLRVCIHPPSPRSDGVGVRYT